MNPIIIILAIFFLVGILLFYHIKSRRKFGDFPSPRSYPIIGHAALLRPNVTERLDQLMGTCLLYSEYPRMTLLWLGPVPVVMLYCAEAIEAVFTGSKHLQKGKLYKFLEQWLGLGLLTTPPSTWKGRRRQLTPTFHYDILKNFVYVFNYQAEIFVKNLKERFKDSKECVVDIGHLLSLCTLDIICETSMGQSVNAQKYSDSEYVKAVHEINDIIQKRQLNPLMWNNTIFKLTKEGKAHDKDIKILHDFRSNVIAKRIKQIELDGGLNVNQKCNFLDLLLEMRSNGELTLEQIECEVDTFMFEGHDTTATALMWFLQIIGCNPEVQQRIRDELYSVLGYEFTEVSFDQLGQLKYLECCIKEALRIFPSVPMFLRKLDHDENVFGKYHIPAGTEIVINAYLTHRDPKYWPEPEKFRPERFMPPESNHRHPYSFIPFSVGSRNCIGQRFALLEEKSILAHVLTNFKVTSMKRMDEIRCKSELILRPLEPILIKLEPLS
uniref:Cytochrome P450 4c3 n=1 Tax=Strongyloides papillosus TaxID=174720 RepID=A0A0N5B1W7_STREA